MHCKCPKAHPRARVRQRVPALLQNLPQQSQLWDRQFPRRLPHMPLLVPSRRIAMDAASGSGLLDADKYHGKARPPHPRSQGLVRPGPGATLTPRPAPGAAAGHHLRPGVAGGGAARAGPVKAGQRAALGVYKEGVRHPERAAAAVRVRRGRCAPRPGPAQARQRLPVLSSFVQA